MSREHADNRSGAKAGSRLAVALVAAVALLLAPMAQAQRTRLKPGWNLFSPPQDIEIGKMVAQDAERKLPMLNDARVDGYLNTLGRRLAVKATGEPYPYQFKAVNDGAINAFALPGGFLYINRGIIEAADNEAQLAGVIAHEIAHVALRHGTNQASKAYAAQVPLAILGGALGSGSVGAVLTRIGAEFGANSVLLKFSRDAERQADILGAQILYDNNYDPRAMAQFFEKVQAESKGGRLPDFFSSHPNPERRMERVNEEIRLLGGPPQRYKTDSPEFQDIKRYVNSLPAPPKGGAAPRRPSSQRDTKPVPPSERYVSYENSILRMVHPDNWRSSGRDGAASFVPEGGLVDDGRGNAALAYGVIVNVFEPRADRYGQITLEDATYQLIDDLRHSNPAMRIARQPERIRLRGLRALSTYLTNDSPVGGREQDWLITVIRPEGLVYLVCVAPEREFDEYEPVFQTMIESIRFPQR